MTDFDFEEYKRWKAAAPRRHSRGKDYFVGHKGITSEGKPELSAFQYEQRLAIALVNEQKNWPNPHQPGGNFRLLDYQFPVNARQSDGAGEIDLFGATDKGQMIIIELKVDRNNDTPVKALQQALRYSAVVEANQKDIANEMKGRFNITGGGDRPPLIWIMGTSRWWQMHPKSAWQTCFARMADEVKQDTDIEVQAVCLDGVSRVDQIVLDGLRKSRPQLNVGIKPDFVSV